MSVLENSYTENINNPLNKEAIRLPDINFKT